MKINLRKVLALLVAFLLVVSITACSNQNKQTNGDEPSNVQEEQPSNEGGETKDTKEPVEISYATFMVGAHASAAAEKEVIDAFNKEYEGKIKVVIEELPSDDAYVNKMKTLAASKSLPDVVMGKNGIRELAIANGQAVDILPLLTADADWSSNVGEGAINYNKTDDGKLYSIANQQQLMGYFYNKDMFEKANITPAKTWDEFMSNNEKLKAAGFTPLALMTGENAWTTNLWLAAMIGTDGAAGNEYMNTTYPETYNNTSLINGLTMLQKCLQDYTTPDAIGAIYANAANNFLQENAAIIANGPWMCPDFSDVTKAKEGLQDRVGVALYPNNGIISQFEVGYVLCTNGKSQEEQEAALEFLKFKTNKFAQGVFLEKAGALPLTTNVAITDEYKAANPIVAELIKLSGEADYYFGNIDNNAYSSVVAEFSIRYPELAFNDITAEEMATYLTKAAELNK
ncbi:MAG: ABC-type sugar transport system, periplasmic component [Herbinix sp.]|jgi:raffinose/stachyose/melibiose transport system substrate-binding protein|nr:ABC-type sugar transport system, periplasmic component [Herbinix sp.]